MGILQGALSFLLHAQEVVDFGIPSSYSTSTSYIPHCSGMAGPLSLKSHLGARSADVEEEKISTITILQEKKYFHSSI